MDLLCPARIPGREKKLQHSRIKGKGIWVLTLVRKETVWERDANRNKEKLGRPGDGEGTTSPCTFKSHGEKGRGYRLMSDG